MPRSGRGAAAIDSDPSFAVFSDKLLGWHAHHGRRNLPWQSSRDPYRVWVSEIMLQQTQVAAVIPYYTRFIERFPSVEALAQAPAEEVMRHWAGLGYYARARNLHQCAREIVATHAGRFPRTAAQLAALPGIGVSTAAAIAAFCYRERCAILDGNVKRVLTRRFGIEGYPGAAAVQRSLFALAGRLLPPSESMPAYTQALMDLGATVCVRGKPRCGACPLADDCRAFREDRTHALPTPRPPKRPTERAVQFLLIRRGDAILLEQRPPHGIWGGLLAPLQCESPSAAQALLARLCPGAVAKASPPRRHAFTHFTLLFTALHARIDGAVQIAAEEKLRWLQLADVDHAPLPAPIRVLLRELARGDAVSGPPG